MAEKGAEVCKADMYKTRSVEQRLRVKEAEIVKYLAVGLNDV